jgi:TonB-dependent receptor
MTFNRSPRFRFICALLANLLSWWFGPSFGFAQSSDPGALRGVVTNEATGAFLEGAEVTLEATPVRTDVTDTQGRFFIGGVAPGSYRLRVVSAGSATLVSTATVSARATQSLNLALKSDIVRLEPLMVTAQAEGQAQSLNLQRNAENIRNVVSEDALANSRLGEVGEILQSMSGIYLEASTHQPVRPVIRGLSSDFNSVTYDGVRIGTWQGTRDAQVGTFPAENLARVEVMKSVTPDQEGDAIGGSINLVSKRAFDLQARQIRVGAGVSYNNQLQNWDKQVSLDYGDRFGREKRLGIFSSINYYRTDRAYHNVAQTYQVNAADAFNIATATLLDRIEEGSWKLKYTGSLDFKLSEATVFSLRGIYSNDRRYLADFRSVYRPGARTNVTPDSATANNGRVDVDRPYREPETINYQIALNVEHTRDLWKLDSTLGFNRISNTYSETITPLMSFNGVNLTYDRSDRDHPLFTITNGVDLSDPSRLSHREIARTQFNSRNLGYNFSINARRDLLQLPFKAYFKTGTRLKYSDWRQDTGDHGWWNYTGPMTPAQFATPYSNDRFMRQSNGRVQMPGSTIDIERFIDIFHTRRNEFTRQDNRSDIRIAQDNTSWQEGVYAAYAMGSARFGNLHVVTGARFERTEYTGNSNEVDAPGGILARVTRTTTTTESDNFLPGINFTYAFSPRFLLRGAVTKTIARPSQQFLLPIRTVDDAEQEVTDGNPDLGVTESVNYDLSVEYYLKPLGVASVGVFQKEIDGFYFDQTETVQSGEFAGYQLTRPGLGKGGRIKGLELELQKRLTFLPGYLSGLGIGTNYTFIDAEGTFPNRAQKLPFIDTARRIGNFNLFYARGSLDLRAFLNYRGPYLTGVGARPALDVYEDERTTLSFFAKYKVNRRVVLNLDVNNISDSAKRSYQGDPSNPRSVRYYDWAINFRVSYSL